MTPAAPPHDINKEQTMQQTSPPASRRLSVDDARTLALSALGRIGYTDDEARIISDHLIDAALRGYKFAGLPRILAVAEKMRVRPERTQMSIVHETPMSAMIDGGGNVGYLAVQHATEIALDKARSSGIAVVGVHNSYYSGRSGYYVEQLTRKDLVGIHLCGAERTVVPHGGSRPALGTNPVCFGFPCDGDPLIYDTGTSAIMHGEVQMRERTGEPLPEGVALDEHGRPTRDAAAALRGGFLPFAEHKGYGLSLCAQALGLLAGSARPQGDLVDYGFFLLAFSPTLLMPAEEFKSALSGLIAEVKATPTVEGVDEILMPSERGGRQKTVNLEQGIVVDEEVYRALQAL
jgi:LDH2 family malate/lactate/ureidoglycolate dehydrogenase